MEFIKKYKIQNWDHYQPLLQKEIERQIEVYPNTWRDAADIEHYGEDGGNVLCDWNNPTRDTEYWNIVQEMIKVPMANYCRQSGTNNVQMTNCWWSRYDVGGTFDWHTHEGCNLCAVIHVDLEDPQDSTKVWGYDKDIEVGDLIIFPAMTAHAGLPAKSKKTIIAMNFDIMIGKGTSAYRKYNV